ncbi:hypothetical protein BDV23DRAFT_153621, partial [Aspergillus alliaceus]
YPKKKKTAQPSSSTCVSKNLSTAMEGWVYQSINASLPGGLGPIGDGVFSPYDVSPRQGNINPYRILTRRLWSGCLTESNCFRRMPLRCG